MATAQDDITGDGTTSNVLIIGELLRQAGMHIDEVMMIVIMLHNIVHYYFFEKCNRLCEF